MERSKKVFKEKEVKDLGEFLFQNALGSVVIFKATPTNATMKANTIGYFDGKLYFKLANGETKSIQATDVS